MTRHDEFEWSINLNRFVEEGSNSLKIVPEERLELRKLLLRAAFISYEVNKESLI